MRERKPIRYLVVPIGLLALLLVAMTVVNICHHHTGSSETTCQICHLSHQPIEPPLAEYRAPALALMGRTPESPDTGLAPTFVFRRLPARAPPTA
ncbi:MAG TPA: hypothetical protein VNM68_00625 [Candidatus Polarisedimenticolia bacterium]|nr:hypothetical protein [Candidatus Polarisedimenticolia bacterium]